jgi:hypothetical protein
MKINLKYKFRRNFMKTRFAAMMLFLIMFVGLTVESYGQRAQTSVIRNATITGGVYSFEIWSRSTGASSLRVGGTSYYFNFNSAALNNPTLPGINSKYSGDGATSDYDLMTVGLVSGQLAVTITYKGNGAGTGDILSSSPTDGELMCKVNLDITNSSQTANLSWDLVNSGMNTPTFQALTEVFSGSDAAVLPIQLSSFSGNFVSQSSVTINWTTMSEVNNYGFYVQKLNAGTNSFVRIDESFIAGQTNSTEPQSYSYTDKNVSGSEVQYRLEQIDNNSLTNFYGPIIVSMNPSGVKDGDAVPAMFKLTQNFPNPFNPSTKISFSLATAGYTTLRVYNVIGQEVATLYNGVAEAGRLYVVNLDATNLNSGIYFCKLVSGSSTEVRKIVAVK